MTKACFSTRAQAEELEEDEADLQVYKYCCPLFCLQSVSSV